MRMFYRPVRRWCWISGLLLLLGAEAWLWEGSVLALPDTRDGGNSLSPSACAVRAPHRGELENDLPRSPAVPTRVDTASFGFYEVRGDGLKYAVRDGIWTWDHGTADPLEGWTSVDLTTNDRAYWRWMNASIWTAEGNPGAWPQMNASSGIGLCGATEGHADTLGWVRGVGYGNNWCQRLTSPGFTYDGSGDIDLSFHYFNQTEEEYDYSRLLLLVDSEVNPLNGAGFTGSIGIDDAGLITQQHFNHVITNEELGGGEAAREFFLRVEVRSDGGRSDQDGSSGFDTFYGAMGIDNVALDGANLDPPVARNFDFETGLSGWTAERCPGVGSLMGVAPLSAYSILDPCDCRLSGYILEMHDDAGTHPDDNSPIGQHELAVSCAVDRKTDLGDPAYLDYNRIYADWAQYSELPQENGVFYRPGWSYYPYENPNVPGLVTWSPRVGQATYFYFGSDPTCSVETNFATDWGLPPDCERVKFIFELDSGCDEFGLPPEFCSGVTNSSPLIDNVRIRMVPLPDAPALVFVTGCAYIDGFGQGPSGLPSPCDPGNADIVYNRCMGEYLPARLGDSLVVNGPTPSATTKWESKLWFRLRRTGPCQESIALFPQWKTAMMAKGIDFFTGPNPNFTWGYMDSVEAASQSSKNRFCSQFRDGPSSGGGGLPADICYNWGGGGEQAEGNEILPDLCFTPGTQIEYFITSNYICQPTEYFVFPDTTGGAFNEFEILPGYRLDGGLPKHPCVLFMDLYNRGGEGAIEQALNHVLTGAPLGSQRPNPAAWDKYDVADASS